MKRLTSDFEMDSYGLHVRLANIDDSAFILGLRTNEKLSRFIHSTDDDLLKQQAWMTEYKKREAEGKDYYFIYERDGCPIGVNRIYAIDEDTRICTGGSWICAPDTEYEYSVATLLILRDIMFDVLGFDKDQFDVRKQNRLVLRTHRMFGAKIVGESEADKYLSLKKEDYLKAKDRILQLLNINL